MDRYPRGSIPPYAFRAVATVAPAAVAREVTEPAPPEVALDADASDVDGVTEVDATAPCDLTILCPTCTIEMRPEHAHYKCPRCGYRDSCCF